MKSDPQLQHDVAEELEWDPAIHSEHIGVVVENGVVTLTGFVTSYPEKIAAETAARRVAGVRGIAEEIQIRLPSSPRTDDAQIAQKILTIFNHDITVPASQIQVQVEKGWVKLTGTVDWHYQREAAARIAGHVLGVTGVSNLLKVRQTATSTDIKDRILAAFERNAGIDASGITIATQGNTVLLSGRVATWKERDLAEKAAWGAPGVSVVDDRLTIA